MRHPSPTRLLHLFLTLLGLVWAGGWAGFGGTGFGAAGATGTPAGTVIENQAVFQAQTDDPAAAPLLVYSGRVMTTVEQVCSLSVLPSGSVQAPGQSASLLPGETATLRYTLTNTGNAANIFALGADTVGGGYSLGDHRAPGDLGVYKDNGSGAVGPSDTPISSLQLGADASARLLVRVGSTSGSRGTVFVNLSAGCAAALGGAADSDNVARVTVADPPALSLTKTFDEAVVKPGGVVGVTLRLNNGGAGVSRAVLVSDLLNTPEMQGFSYVPGSAAASAGATEFSPDGLTWQPGEPAAAQPLQGLRWRLDSLAPGAEALLQFKLTAPVSEVGERQNLAQLSSSGAPTATAAASVTVRYSPGLAVGPLGNAQARPGGEASSDDLQLRPAAFAGQEVCFRHSEQNLGDRDDALSVTALLTSGQVADQPGVRLLELDGSALVQPITLAPGAAHDFQVCVVPAVSASGTAEPLALRLTVNGVRGAPENATLDRIAALVAGQPTLSKSVQPAGSVRQGTLLTYTLTVTNPLPVDLTDVVLSDPLDAHLDYVLSEGGALARSTGNQSTVTWTIGTLEAGQTLSRTLTARVRADTPDDTVISNAFGLSSSEYPAPLTSATVLTPVFAGGLTFSKTSMPAEVSIGDVVTYTFLVRNPSAVATLRMVEINDSMPGGLQYIPGSSRFNGAPIADPATVGQNYIWALPELGPGTQHEVVFEARVLPSATGDRIKNTAIARAISANGSETPQLSASATNRITPLLFAPVADIVGYVFQDVNRDGRYQQGADVPIASARVILAGGRVALTDASGRYHFGSVREGFAALRLDPSSVAQQPLSVPQDGGRPGSRGLNVRGLTSADFALQPNSASIEVLRDTTVEVGTVTQPGLLTLRKQVFTTSQEGVYRVQLSLTAAQALPGFALDDPLPEGASLLDGPNTLKLVSLPGGERVLVYSFRFAGPPSAAVTDPDVTWQPNGSQP
jgi:uncharacterized repeat protein (TIGR01451 family)/fimbrial isopeptide formation D2 family protein